MRGGLRRRTVLLGLITAGVLSAAVPAAATTTFTWSGGGVGREWSAPGNWGGGIAPSIGPTPVDLDFTGEECGFLCTTIDDIPNLAVETLTLDNNVVESPWRGDSREPPSLVLPSANSISGSAPIDLSGGLDVVTTVRGEGTTVGSAEMYVGAPIVLTAPNAWSLGFESGLGLDGGVSGDYPLDISMSNGVLELIKAIEVGPLTITGEGAASAFNIGPEGDVNGADKQSVNLHDVGLHGLGRIGPLTLVGGELGPEFFVSERSSPALTVEGPLTLSGHVNWYSLLEAAVGVRVAGSADLGSATLEVRASPCVVPGTVYTLVEAQGGVTGVFTDEAGAPITNGETVQAASPYCGGGDAIAQVQIEYSSHAVTATVLTSGAPMSLGTQSRQQPPASVAPSAIAGTVVTRAEIASLLRRELNTAGKTARIAGVLKADDFLLNFSAPEAGSALIDWYQVPRGARVAKKTRAKAVLVASGRVTFTGPGIARLRIRLTSGGCRKLEPAKSLRLTATGAFTPTGQTPVTAAEVFALRR